MIRTIARLLSRLSPTMVAHIARSDDLRTPRYNGRALHQAAVRLSFQRQNELKCRLLKTHSLQSEVSWLGQIAPFFQPRE